MEKSRPSETEKWGVLAGFLLILMVIVTLFGGCAHKIPKDVRDSAYAAVQEKSETKVFQVVAEKLGRTIGQVSFDTDSAALDAISTELLRETSSIIKSNPDAVARVAGFADERGFSKSNLILGMRRAEAVADVLLAYGVTEDQISVVSFGEADQVCRESSTECWRLNRRVLVGIEVQ